MSDIAQACTGSAFTSIDFDRPGHQIGFINIPHSPHDDAWGVTQVPVTVVTNGKGPTVVIEGGNHGDEYEGPIVIPPGSRPAASIEPGTSQPILSRCTTIRTASSMAGGIRAGSRPGIAALSSPRPMA